MRKNKKGFTLVELVIVIAVIAILAAVLLPTFAGIVERANLSKVTQRAEAVRKEVLAQYYDSIVDMKDVKFIVRNDRYTYTYTIGADGQFAGKPIKSTGEAALPVVSEIDETSCFKNYDNDVVVIIPCKYNPYDHDDDPLTTAITHIEGYTLMHFGTNVVTEEVDITTGVAPDTTTYKAYKPTGFSMGEKQV